MLVVDDGNDLPDPARALPLRGDFGLSLVGVFLGVCPAFLLLGEELLELDSLSCWPSGEKEI